MNAQNIPLYYNIRFFALFSAITQVMKHGAARFRAFGNIADVLMKMENLEEANGVYQKQLILSKQSRDKRFEASAFGSLGVCHRLSKQFDKALGYHTQVISEVEFLFLRTFVFANISSIFKKYDFVRTILG